MAPILDVAKLRMDFGGLRAVNDVDLFINQGEIVALIGPNGAGKTTFFNCITGVNKPTAGDVIICPPASGKRERINGMRNRII